jgi:hypothetical protein
MARHFILTSRLKNISADITAFALQEREGLRDFIDYLQVQIPRCQPHSSRGTALRAKLQPSLEYCSTACARWWALFVVRVWMSQNYAS